MRCWHLGHLSTTDMLRCQKPLYSAKYRPLSLSTQSREISQKLSYIAKIADIGPPGAPQGGRSWLAFGERKIIPQSFRRARVCANFRNKNIIFLQMRK